VRGRTSTGMVNSRAGAKNVKTSSIQASKVLPKGGGRVTPTRIGSRNKKKNQGGSSGSADKNRKEETQFSKILLFKEPHNTTSPSLQGTKKRGDVKIDFQEKRGGGLGKLRRKPVFPSETNRKRGHQEFRFPRKSMGKNQPANVNRLTPDH